MFCCVLSSKKSSKYRIRKKEIQRFSTSAPTINYRTAFPYAHAIKNDTIQVESSDVVDTNATDISLFNGTMPDRTTKSLSFDDENKTLPVSATRNDDGHCLFERLIYINNVSAVNSSRNIPMSSTKSSKFDSSNAVPMARPFDEFAFDVKTSNNPLDGQIFDTTKSDKD